MQRKYMAVLGGVIATIFAPIILSNEDTSLDTYLLGGFIVTEVMIFVFDQIFQNRRELRHDRKKHTKDIYEIFNRMSEVGLQEEKGNFVLTLPRRYRDSRKMSDTEILNHVTNRDSELDRTTLDYLHLFEDYDYFDFAMEHLKHKKYKDVYKHWENAEKIIQQYNNEEKFSDLLQHKIKESLKIKFSEFEESKAHSYPDHFYVIRNIAQYLQEKFKYYRDQEPEIWVNDLIIDKINSDQHCITKRGTISPCLGSIDESKLSLDQYKILLVKIATDEDVKKSLKNDIDKTLEIYNHQEQFRKELQKLITHLRAGEIIEGKCSIGY